jgi:hypothetical protein
MEFEMASARVRSDCNSIFETVLRSTGSDPVPRINFGGDVLGRCGVAAIF